MFIFYTNCRQNSITLYIVRLTFSVPVFQRVAIARLFFIAFVVAPAVKTYQKKKKEKKSVES